MVGVWVRAQTGSNTKWLISIRCTTECFWEQENMDLRIHQTRRSSNGTRRRGRDATTLFSPGTLSVTCAQGVGQNVTSLGSSRLEVQPTRMRMLGYVASTSVFVENEYVENQRLLLMSDYTSCGRTPPGIHLSERLCENFRCGSYFVGSILQRGISAKNYH